jgi:hypothetical protein
LKVRIKDAQPCGDRTVASKCDADFFALSTVNFEGYLFEIPSAAGQLLLNLIDAEQQKIGKATVDSQIENGIRSANLD